MVDGKANNQTFDPIKEVKSQHFGRQADRLASMRKSLIEIRDERERMEEIVRGIFGADYHVDEMALYARRPAVIMNFLREVMAIEGYDLFNRADDLVEVSPIPSSYLVEYWFVRTPYDFRLEIMSLIQGFSPLHEVYSRHEETDRCVANVHASFKVPSSEAYTEAQVALRQAGWECAQRCESEYGKFSYFINDEVSTHWYLKPRVNLRDSGSVIS